MIQSAIMLRFGAEVPALAAAGKCSRTVQFPIPTDWSDPEVSAQRARTKVKHDNLRTTTNWIELFRSR